MPSAYWNKALAILLSGDLLQGWSEYEWRWYADDLLMPTRRRFKQPRWDGSPLDGQTILIYAEQGFGDTLQFARYVPMVRQRGRSRDPGVPEGAEVLTRGPAGRGPGLRRRASRCRNSTPRPRS